MSPSDILDEHEKGDSLSVDVLRALLRERIDIETICRRVKKGLLDPPRIDRVVYKDDGRGFEFGRHIAGESGIGAMTFVVRDHVGDPIDIAAWNGGARRPSLWCSRGCLLGAENLFVPRIVDALHVHATAFEWLQAGCRGVVIVDEQKARGILRRADQDIRIESPEYAKQLDRLLSYRPRIFVPSERRAAA
jgi:hypothetical protein